MTDEEKKKKELLQRMDEQLLGITHDEDDEVKQKSVLDQKPLKCSVSYTEKGIVPDVSECDECEFEEKGCTIGRDQLIGGQCEHGNPSVLQCDECDKEKDKAAVPNEVVEKIAKQLVVKMVQALLDDPVRMKELAEKTFELYDKGEK